MGPFSFFNYARMQGAALLFIGAAYCLEAVEEFVIIPLSLLLSNTGSGFDFLHALFFYPLFLLASGIAPLWYFEKAPSGFFLGYLSAFFACFLSEPSTY